MKLNFEKALSPHLLENNINLNKANNPLVNNRKVVKANSRMRIRNSMNTS